MNAAFDEQSNIQFDTEAFSVYAVIVNPANQGIAAENLDGMVVKINKKDGQYLKNVTNYNNNPWVIEKGDSSEAAEFVFEATNKLGEYNIYTIVDNEKKYININHHINEYSHSDKYDSACVNLAGKAPMALKVTDNKDGTYGISRTIGNITYYLNQNEGDNGPGFAAYIYNDDNSKLTFAVTHAPENIAAGQYAIVVKSGGKYYSVFNDGTLREVDKAYDAGSNVLAAGSDVTA
ncbi:MAG: hypothetical protein IKG59_07155, partial [Firmicutes bacterium]|nr:hypothetical protein [Bacillota bacterium]